MPSVLGFVIHKENTHTPTEVCLFTAPPVGGKEAQRFPFESKLQNILDLFSPPICLLLLASPRVTEALLAPPGWQWVLFVDGGGHSTHMYEPSPYPGWVVLSGGSDTKWHRQIFCCAFIPFERIFQQLPPSDRVANNIHDSLSFECNMNADYTVKLKLN